MLSSNYWYKQARILDYLSLMRTFLETLDMKPDILLEIKAVDCCVFSMLYIFNYVRRAKRNFCEVTQFLTVFNKENVSEKWKDDSVTENRGQELMQINIFL